MSKSSLGQRLALYSSAAGASVMAGSAMAAPVDAEISVSLTATSDGTNTDSTEVQDIDITGNEFNDFRLSVRDRSNNEDPDSPLTNCGTVRLIPYQYAGSAVAVEADGYAALIAAGAEVGPDLDFGVGGAASTLFESCFRGEGFELGQFQPGTRGFLGLRFEVGGNTHYGFADVEVQRASTTGIIHSICYEDEPDTPISTDACADEEAPPDRPEAVAVPVGGAVPLGLLLFAAGAAALHRRRRNPLSD